MNLPWNFTWFVFASWRAAATKWIAFNTTEQTVVTSIKEVTMQSCKQFIPSQVLRCRGFLPKVLPEPPRPFPMALSFPWFSLPIYVCVWRR